MSNQLWWYTARAGGLVAWALLAASVLWGLALSTKVAGKRPRPNWMLDLHRFLGGLALVVTAVHVLAIMADSYVSFGLTQVLVPLASTWHPMAVAWGIVGLYLLAAVEVTSLLRKQLPKRVWRATHVLSFPMFLLTTIHVLSAGTDRHNVVLRGAMIAASAAVTGLTFVRVRQANNRRNAPPPPRVTPRQPAPDDERVLVPA